MSEKLNTLFIGYDIPAALDYKHNKLIPLLDSMGFEQTELEGDLVHIIPESRVAEIQKLVEDANEAEDFNLTCGFEDYHAEPWLACTIELTGKTKEDLQIALEEVRKKIDDWYISGFDSNDSGSYTFNVKKVEPDDSTQE